MIKANELRVGNLLEYHVNEEGMTWEPTAIDHQDIAWCTTDEDNFNKVHRPIPLTEDWLLKLGFEVRESSTCKEWYIGMNEITHDWLFSITWLDRPELINAPNAPFYRNGRHALRFVHQLQNLYFALTGKELEIKEA